MTNAFSLEERAPLRKPLSEQMEASLLPGSHDWDVRGTLHAAARADILKMCLEISLGQPMLRQAHRLPPPNKKSSAADSRRNLLCPPLRARVR
jgi:hypothetical protein